MREQPVLLRVATAPKAFMRDDEVEDQAPAASLVSQVVPNLHVAAPLAHAGRDSMLGADSGVGSYDAACRLTVLWMTLKPPSSWDSCSRMSTQAWSCWFNVL